MFPSESPYFFAGLLFVLVFDGSDGAYLIATLAEYNAVIRVFHDCSFFAFFLFKFESAVVAVFYAFSAGNAFLIVYYWVPGDFVSRDSIPGFFNHIE